MAPKDLATLRAALVDDETRRGVEFARVYADAVDEWIASVLDTTDGFAVIGVGATGRRHLTPGSDLDLVLVHDGRRDVSAIAERLWYPIWNSGVALDHSVRSEREVVTMADRDLKVVLGLLDGRVIAGDVPLGTRVLDLVHERWRSGAKRRLAELDRMTRDRHERFGDVAYLLEPDLKEGKGGLRDVRVLHAIRATEGFLQPPDATLDAADEALLTVRIELHRAARRPSDRLGLELQDVVAKRLGRSADELMAEVARAARTIARASDDQWRRARSWVAGPGRRAGRDRAIGDGIVLRDGDVQVVQDASLYDPTLVLRVAGAAARFDAPFGSGVVDQLTRAAVPGVPWDDASRDALLGLLGSGPPLVAVVEELDRHGLFARLLPEWESVRSLPQRNALHRFTVDRHLVETVVEAAALTREVSRPDLLLVGAWLHDLGKGSPGDHTEAGVELMQSIATRLGFVPADVATLVAMVRHHLLLPSVATSRDLDDPATIGAVADAVEDTGTLELLVALTQADSLATNASLWTDWKAQLVSSLARRVAQRLAGDDVGPGPAPIPDEIGRLAAETDGAARVVPDADGVWILAPDEPGVLGVLVGLLTVHGQNVRSVVAASDGRGTVVDRFVVEPVFGRAPSWDDFRDDVDAALAGRYPLWDRLDDRSRRYHRRPDAAHVAPPRVVVHSGASRDATVVEVRAADEIGLLARIVAALGALGLDIVQARVVTLGHEAVDTFYVRDAATGRAVDDRADAICTGIRDRI